jgi:hypothetical protein
MTDTHDKHGYPLQGFFIAHKRFMGHPFPPQGEWGDILDGPEVDHKAVIEAILEAWADDQFPPDREDLRVWLILPNKPAEDFTAWAVRIVMVAIQLREEGF